MNVWKPLALVAGVGLAASVATQIASAGDQWSCPNHGNLTTAFGDLRAAKEHMSAAQQANDFDMKGHAAQAKTDIDDAQAQIKQACEVLNGKH